MEPDDLVLFLLEVLVSLVGIVQSICFDSVIKK